MKIIIVLNDDFINMFNLIKEGSKGNVVPLKGGVQGDSKYSPEGRIHVEQP
jgi:hypothetical protein